MAKKRIKAVELPLKSKKKLSKSTGITSPKKSAPKSTRSKRKIKVNPKLAAAELKSPSGHIPGWSRGKPIKRKKAKAKASAKAKAKARKAKAKKRGPIKQPKTRNPRKKGS